MNGVMSMIATVYDLATVGLQRAIVAGGWAALLAVAVLAINVIGRRWISAGQMGVLWGLVLVRLLLPMAPPSVASMQNLIWPDDVESIQAQATRLDAVAVEAAAADDAQSVGPYSAAHSAPPGNAVLLEAVLDMLPVAWLIAAVVGFSWTVAAHLRFCRHAGSVPACRDERLLGLWRSCCERAGVRRSIPILVFDGVRQPCVMGAMRPKLLLPNDAAGLDDERLQLVMLHELAHVRRCDVAVNWLLVVIRAVHWWNPVYWLAAARFSNLREQACDAFVMRRGGQSARAYSELLLTFAERELPGRGWRVTLPAAGLGLLPTLLGKRAVRNRLRALHSAGLKQNRWHAGLVAASIALVAAGGLTDAKPPAQATDSAEWLPKATIDQRTWSVAQERDDGPVVTRTYDVAGPLERLAAEVGPGEAAERVLKSHFASVLSTSQVLQTAPVIAEPGSEQADRPGPEFSLDGTKLIVSASEGMHRALQRYLAAWQEGGFGQISIECRFLSGLPDLASTMGVSWQYVETSSADSAGELPADRKDKIPLVRAAAAIDDYFLVGLAALDEPHAAALMQMAQGDRRANVLQAPKVTIFNGQQATICDVTQTPFVIGMRENKDGLRVPKIAVVEEGVKITLRAARTADPGRVQLSARIALSQIGEVRTVSNALREEAASIQIPRVKRSRIDVASEVENGQSLLIGCVPAYDEQRFFYVLLTVRNLSGP
jgi:bla regulator protein blaR1